MGEAPAIRYLSVRAVMEASGLPRSSAYELMSALGAVYILGRSKRLLESRLIAFLRQQKQEASAPHAAVLARSIVSLPGIDAPSTAGVYAVQGAGGFIKIGKGKNIAARIKDLQCAHPVPIKLLAVLSTDPSDEVVHHRRWAHLRCQGEWFEPDHELIEFLAKANP